MSTDPVPSEASCVDGPLRPHPYEQSRKSGVRAGSASGRLPFVCVLLLWGGLHNADRKIRVFYMVADRVFAGNSVVP